MIVYTVMPVVDAGRNPKVAAGDPTGASRFTPEAFQPSLYDKLHIADPNRSSPPTVGRSSSCAGSANRRRRTAARTPRHGPACSCGGWDEAIRTVSRSGTELSRAYASVMAPMVAARTMPPRANCQLLGQPRTAHSPSQAMPARMLSCVRFS